MRHNRYLRAYHEAREVLHGTVPMYLAKYGIVPEFKAAFHGGRVVRGEIGDIKTDMVFHGDVLNTTARILELCFQLDKEILITSDLIEKMEDDEYFTPELCGSIRLRGKKEPVELHCIKSGSTPNTHSLQTHDNRMSAQQ